MADTIPVKRQREEEDTKSAPEEEPKRLKQSPYNQILSLLEDTEEQDSSEEDLTSLISSLQQELSSPVPSARLSSSLSCESSCDDEDTERVMRRLIEASDDELGIPSCGYESLNKGGSDVNNGFGWEGETADEKGFGSLSDGLWELEDEAANYYTLLQSELFM